MTPRDPDPIQAAEQLLASHSAELTDPREGECLYHYLDRMLETLGCAGHRFTERWAKDRRVRGRPVLEWAVATGGCCCDCEVIMNSFRARSNRRRGLLCADALRELEQDDQQRWRERLW
jgi:hypothetical protein